MENFDTDYQVRECVLFTLENEQKFIEIYFCNKYECIYRLGPTAQTPTECSRERFRHTWPSICILKIRWFIGVMLIACLRHVDSMLTLLTSRDQSVSEVTERSLRPSRFHRVASDKLDPVDCFASR